MTDRITKTVTGTLTLLPNPCTTRPCLPGMAMAVMGHDGVLYFLTEDDGFQLEWSAEGNDMLAVGDKVVAHGEVFEKHDIAGNKFTTIEMGELRRAG